jgi:DNA primase
MLLPQNHDPDSLIREEGLNGFKARMQVAQALSEYFFEHFSQDLKLSEMEGRSNLKNEAESYLKQLPIGAFREMMFEELSRLSKQHIFDNESFLAYKKNSRSQRQKSDRLSLPSSIMALLIQKPALIEVVEQKNIDWSYWEFDGVERFVAILAMILKYKPANQGLLLELYRGHIDESIIKRLAAAELSVSDDQAESFFSDALNRLFTQAKSAKLDKLLAKDKVKGLDMKEKELLRTLLANK